MSENSSKVRAFHVVSLECIAEVKVAGVVNKVLSGESPMFVRFWIMLRDGNDIEDQVHMPNYTEYLL